MKNIMYFILAIASLLFLGCIGYSGLVVYAGLPEVELISNIGGMYVLASAAGDFNFWTAIPVLIVALFAFFNLFDRNIKILFFVILILVIVLDVLVLFFPDVIVQIVGKQSKFFK